MNGLCHRLTCTFCVGLSVKSVEMYGYSVSTVGIFRIAECLMVLLIVEAGVICSEFAMYFV